jgi:hypothetical protein
LNKADESYNATVWDDEFRFTVYEVEGEQQKLKITVMRQEHKQETEVVGEAYVAIDGKWKDHEFDGEYLAVLLALLGGSCSCRRPA